jgi:hypothetical protein
MNLTDNNLIYILPSGKYFIGNENELKEEYIYEFEDNENIYGEIIDKKNNKYAFTKLILENGEEGLYLLNSRDKDNEDFKYHLLYDAIYIYDIFLIDNNKIEDQNIKYKIFESIEPIYIYRKDIYTNIFYIKYENNYITLYSNDYYNYFN